MTRSKLSDLEKQEIISLFEQEQETISGLAQRYQVSASTIRRLLKPVALEPMAVMADAPAVDEPPVIIKPKPVPRRPEVKSLSEGPDSDRESEAHSVSRTPTFSPAANKPQKVLEERDPPRVVRRRSVAESADAEPLGAGFALDDPEPTLTAEDLLAEPISFSELPHDRDEINAIIEEIGHALEGRFADSPLVDEDDEEDDDDDDFDALEEDVNDLDELDGFDDFDDAGDTLATSAKAIQLQPEVFVEVMPLDQAVLPKTCYLVVDRTAELVTRPLKDFAELGQIPEHEIQSRTLPVFDNHRIARRFSHRTQRIIKVPNGNMLRAACAQLSAKGITRLLVNGRIYAL
ncbi:MAG: hypothetical protein WCD18_21225 [Thermosynechococcaceae cyanobacterium]